MCTKTTTKGLYNCKCTKDTNINILVTKEKLELIQNKTQNETYKYRLNNNSANLMWFAKENKYKTKLVDVKFINGQITEITKYNKNTLEVLGRKKDKNSFRYLARYNLLNYNYTIPIYFYQTDFSGRKLSDYFLYDYYPKQKMYEIKTDNEGFKNLLSLESIKMILAESSLKNLKFEKNLEYGLIPVYDYNKVITSNSLKILHKKESKLTGEIIAYHNKTRVLPIAYRKLVFNGNLMQRFDNFEKECKYYDDKFKTGGIHSDSELKDKIEDIGILIKDGKFIFTNKLKQAIKKVK